MTSQIEKIEEEATVENQAQVTETPETSKEAEVSKQADPTIIEGEAETEMVPLPEGVTAEPRNDEELHTDLVRRSKYMLETYISVTDDKGHLHQDLALEKEMKDFFERNANINNLSDDALRQRLEEAKSLGNRYSPKVNITEAITSGKIAKYRIREGRLYNLEKRIVKKLKLRWELWFKENHKGISLRSAQVYMNVAAIPKVIPYSFLGLERLIHLERAISVIKGDDPDDPLGEYLRKYGLILDPSNPDKATVDGIRDQVETLIIMNRIKKVEEKNDLKLGIEEDLVRDIVKLGKGVDDSRINNLVLVSKNGGDPNHYLKEIFENGGSEPNYIEAEKKVRALPAVVSTLKETVDYMKAHTEFVSRINNAHIMNLETHLAELKTLINNQQ